MHLTLSWLYGILAIASLFITVAMCRMSWDRLVERRTRPVKRPDLYLRILIYAGLHGVGGVIWWVLRAWDAVVNRELNVGSWPSWIIAAAVLYAVGKGGLVFASAVNGKPLIWRAFIGVCLVWSAFLWWDVLGLYPLA